MVHIESLFSTRNYINPQWIGDRIFFISNLSGQYNLYAMDHGGSIPEPLLPPHIAMNSRSIYGGELFIVFPQLDSIVLFLDEDGDETFQALMIPLDGGFPESVFGEQLKGDSVHCFKHDMERGLLYLLVESRTESIFTSYRADLKTKELTLLGKSQFGGVDSINQSHTKMIFSDEYGQGDYVISLQEEGSEEQQLLHGVPLKNRKRGQSYRSNGIDQSCFVAEDTAILFRTSLFTDTYGLGYLDLKTPQEVKPISIMGIVHEGIGEMETLRFVKDNRYIVGYNIDGCSWLYEGSFEPETLTMTLEMVVCGKGKLSNGVLKSFQYSKKADGYVATFSTATSPVQIYTIGGEARDQVTQHTRERILGIKNGTLSEGEDASFISHDGMRVSARLYLPPDSLGFQGPRPLLVSIHGGPKSQVRPELASLMVLMTQYMTLNGFAVFVPNMRGSTGYGYSYMEAVSRDWGGEDRLDHVHAVTQILPKDQRLDMSRTGVIGGSYGGYMTLTLASRHPELWSAAADLMGPFNLITFTERVPESWKPTIAQEIGDPVKDKDFLLERSPHTYIDQITCPLLVFQGKKDTRVVEQEALDLIEYLQKQGKEVEHLFLEDEGHGITKIENQMRSFKVFTDFFKKHLKP